MMNQPERAPAKAWIVVFAGTAVNLCLGILYAWSVWKGVLFDKTKTPGAPMTGLNEGWTYLTNAEATWAYSLCGFMFALFMIPGGRIQDRFGPKWGATLGGLFLAGGCILAGVMKNYTGLIVGFGILGGIGMGLGYAAATPAAVRWFGIHKRALIVGLVVGGYGGAAIYISPLAKWLIGAYGLSGSFIGLGIFFAVVIVAAAQLLAWPPPGYQPPPPPASYKAKPATSVDWPASQMLKTWQFYALVFMFICSAQAGLLVIVNAAPMLNVTAASITFFAANAWLLSSYGGLVNAAGRVGTGFYSDKLGRSKAYLINGAVSAVCLFLMPTIVQERNVLLLFLVVGVTYWQYGGGLALFPAYTADFFGSKNLGLNYGLMFIGWGIAFAVPLVSGYVVDATKRDDLPFYISGGLLTLALLVSQFVSRPVTAGES